MKKIINKNIVLTLIIVIVLSMTQISVLKAYASTSSDFYIVEGVLLEYIGKDENVIIPDSVTAIAAEAFNQRTFITSITIPNSVTSIGDKAFAYCSGLTSITIPDSVTSIGVKAFVNCVNLTSIALPKGITKIEDGMFIECANLTSITIPSGVTSIGNLAFYHCYVLKSIDIPQSVTSVGNDAFAETMWLDFKVNEFEVAGNNVLIKFNPIGSDIIKIPDGVKYIGGGVFNGYSSITSITIPSSVKDISPDSFEGCKDLIIYCEPGSIAENYAKSVNIIYKHPGDTIYLEAINTASQLTDNALRNKTFYDYNIAYEVIQKVTDDSVKQTLLSKLASIATFIWTDEIKTINNRMIQLASTGSGKIYDEIQGEIQNTNLTKTDKEYFLGEVSSWGKKLVFTDDYKLALDSIITVWNSLNTSEVNQALANAEENVRNIKNSVNRDYLQQQLNQIKGKLSKATTPNGSGSGDKRKAVIFITSSDKLITITKNDTYYENLSKVNNMLKNTFGLTYIPGLSWNGRQQGTAYFRYDDETKRYFLRVGGWRYSYDSDGDINTELNAILETFYAICGDKDVAVSIWNWLDTKNVSGSANTSDYGFVDVKETSTGRIIEKNGIQIEVVVDGRATTFYFN